MGLDSHLFGIRYFDQHEQQITQKEGELLDLSYWRKNWTLHEYIVKTFAAGVDECQPITLTRDNLEKVVAELPIPKDHRKDDRKVFTKALHWLLTAEEGKPREVVYQASW